MTPEIEYEFVVRVIVDAEHPKRPSIDQIENRLGDGPQWMDGVNRVEVEFERQEPSER